MNEEEVEVLESEQEQQQQVDEQPQRQRQTLKETIDDVGNKINTVGEIEENLGKSEQKVADWLDGGEKVTKATSDIGTATSSAAEKGTTAAKRAADAKKAAAETTEKSAKGAKEAAKAGKTAARTGKAAAKGVEGAGEGMSAAGSSPYTAGLKVAGEAVKTGGKIGEGISTAAETGAQAAETAAATAEAGAKAAKEAALAEKAALNAAEAGAKASKAGNQALKKAGDSGLSDKLRQKGKFHEIQGRRKQELSKKFNSDQVMDDIAKKAGNLGKVLKGISKVFDPRTIAVLFLLFIILGTLIVSYILSPLFYMNIIQGTVSDPDRMEKVQNFIAGLGFSDSKEAFYEEVDYLNTHYGNQLDIPYIMSALYYIDIFYGTTSNSYSDDNSKICGNTSGDACESLQLGFQVARNYMKEANTTTDDNGLVYSANKLYRLRELAKHQFLGKKTKEVSLSEYVELNAEKMQNELGNMSKYTSFLVAYIIAHIDPTLGSLYDSTISGTTGGAILLDFIKTIEGTESWASIKVYFGTGKYDSGLVSAITNFLETYLGSVLNIKSIRIKYDDVKDLKDFGSLGFDEAIKITYYEDAFNLDAFEDYLIDYYIRYMPEFSKAIGGLQEKQLEDRIDQIAYEIKYTKTIFESLYKSDESAQTFGECIGDVDLDLLEELVPPIDLTKGQSIAFEGSNNYGLLKGVMHKGVDLEESSTGTKAGDSVYSIYDGRVTQSTVDGTYPDKTAKGGWVVIEYTIQYEDSSLGDSKLSNKFKSKMSTIRVFYGGLDSSKLTLKQDDIVSKGDVIGYVGDASVSETGEKPSVHFAVYDVKNAVFLNPINMFITCKHAGSVKNSCDSSDAKTIEIPSSVLDIKQINYDVEQYDERGFGGNGIDGTSPEKKVHDLWLDDGLRYEKGIAVLNVNGKDRYLVAVTHKFGDIGDLINANLENGEVIELVIADEKDYEHTRAVNDGELCDTEGTTDPGCYGHYKGSEGLGVLEFDFNPIEIFHNGIYSASAMGLDWDTSQKVISISNCGSVFEE